MQNCVCRAYVKACSLLRHSEHVIAASMLAMCAVKDSLSSKRLRRVSRRSPGVLRSDVGSCWNRAGADPRLVLGEGSTGAPPRTAESGHQESGAWGLADFRLKREVVFHLLHVLYTYVICCCCCCCGVVVVFGRAEGYADPERGGKPEGSVRKVAGVDCAIGPVLCSPAAGQENDEDHQPVRVVLADIYNCGPHLEFRSKALDDRSRKTRFLGVCCHPRDCSSLRGRASPGEKFSGSMLGFVLVLQSGKGLYVT